MKYNEIPISQTSIEKKKGKKREEKKEKSVKTSYREFQKSTCREI